MELGNDLRYAWRQLRRSPGFAIASVLTLALGIGATTTMFSVIDQVLLRPMPYQAPAQLVDISQTEYAKDTAKGAGGISLPNALDWQTRSHTMETAYYTQMSPVLGGIQTPRTVTQLITSTNFLSLFGVRPRLGRGFATQENTGAASHVAVLGAEAWHELFNSDPGIIGRDISLNAAPYLVIGVMPDSFRFQGSSSFLFTPLDVTTKELQDRSSGMLSVIGRLRPGLTAADASRELMGIKRQNLKMYPDKELDNRIVVQSYEHMLTGSVRPGLLALNGLVLAVWLLAAINVAGLMLTRTQTRRREIAVRAALGARAGRLMRQFLVESLILSLAGGACGLAITAIALRVLRQYLANFFLNGDLIHVDAAVCLYVLITSCGSALVFGIVPALQAARLPILSGLREGSAGSGASRGQALLRDGLVTVEIALSLLMLSAAGTMAQTLYNMRHTALGFNPDHVVTAELILPQKGYWFAQQPSATANLTQSFLQPMLARVRQLPGVTSAGVTTIRPLRPGMSFLDRVKFADRPKLDAREQQSANLRAATPDYFRAMGISLVEGRFFSEQDDSSAPVATVVNRAFVRQIVVKGSPLGMRVEDEDNGPHKYATIVGVMDDARQGMGDAAAPEMLFNLNQVLPADSFYFLVNFHLDLIVRSKSDPASLIPAITQIIHGLNPDVGVNQAELMQTAVDDTMGSQRLAAHLLSLFAVAALVIAAAGLYGLLAYQVTQQLRDFGVRLALGAQRRDVLWAVLRRALILVAVGGALGIVVSLGFGRVAASLLAGVDTRSILLVVEVVTLLLAATCITASYIPARRAAQTDPMQALRHE